MMIKILNSLLNEANISLSLKQKNQLIYYVELLQKWNKTYNLTSIHSPQQILIRHILDSIIIEKHLKGKYFIDVGTGAGLPGIPLSIVRPKSHFTLLDCLGKRIRFLYQVRYELRLRNIVITQSRIENFIPRLSFDGIISRAFSSLNNTLNLCKSLINEQGYFYILKGIRPDHEISALSTEFVVEKIESLDVPKLHASRHLIVIKLQ